MQVYITIISIPGLFRIFYGAIVDSKIVKYRKYYLLFFGLLAFFTLMLVFTEICNNQFSTTISLFVMNIAATFLDVVIDSLIIEQARKDPSRGQ